jgi:hypothetical protein
MLGLWHFLKSPWSLKNPLSWRSHQKSHQKSPVTAHFIGSMARKLRIAVSVFFGVLTLLLCVMWVRSAWRHDYAHCPLRSPRMLIVQSYHRRLSLYAGERVPFRTGWFPSGWGVDSHSLAKTTNQPRPFWDYSSDQFGRYVLLPHGLPVLVAIVLTSAPWIGWSKQFSLRTLLIATTLLAVMLGLAVWAGR